MHTNTDRHHSAAASGTSVAGLEIHMERVQAVVAMQYTAPGRCYTATTIETHKASMHLAL